VARKKKRGGGSTVKGILGSIDFSGENGGGGYAGGKGGVLKRNLLKDTWVGSAIHSTKRKGYQEKAMERRMGRSDLEWIRAG